MSSADEVFHPGRLWSLWDMQKVFGENYIRLGQQIANLRTEFELLETWDDISPQSREEHRDSCRKCMKHLIVTCEELGLTSSQALVSHHYDDLPQTKREYEMLLRAVMAEVNKTFFLYVPAHLAKYYEIIFPSIITTAFPLASKELVASGNCLAAGLYTACVFHAMRAAEIGLRVLGKTVDVSFPDKPIELAEWQQILDQAESKIKDMQKAPTKDKKFKDEELHFFAQAAKQFTYFKDAWRVRVAHARETYEEAPATRVFSHTLEFFEVLATRLSEPQPAV